MMQELSTIDDLPASNVELEPEKIEDGKDGGPSFHCDLYDTELVHKIAQVFIPGLATACVDNTSGDIFKTPASVAADVRKEMVENITQRSENFVAESVILEGGQDGQVSDHPFDIISDFVDDFASSKRNLFSRVSGWLLSENREDKIDDFVQEMEINAFWLVDKREAIVQSLLKNVDLKNEYHCNMKFHSPEELAAHVSNCSYRSVSCTNEGCNAIFCARQVDKHDAICPFKIIPCERNCSNTIMRREMDRHCITVCPMKLVSCPFYAVGCQSPVPHGKLEQHRSDDLHSHLLFVLQSIHKEASTEDLKRRLEQLKETSSSNQFAQAGDVRSLTSAVKDFEAKLGPVEVSRKRPEDLEAKHGPEEVGRKNPEDVETKTGPKEVSSKPEEDLEVTPVPKEVSKQSEYLEEKPEPKEVSKNPAEDLEAKPAPKEVSSEAKPAPKEVSSKPLEDLEAKPAPKEVCSSKPLEYVEARLEGVSSKAPTELETKLGRKEVSSELPEEVEINLVTREVGSKPPEELETQLGTKEVSRKPPQELEAKLGSKEVGSKPMEELETQLGTKEVSSKPKEELETQLGTKEVSRKSPEELETSDKGSEQQTLGGD